MPWRTRLFAAIYDRTLAGEVGTMTTEQIVADRRRTLPARPPVSWVTGAARRHVTVTAVTCRARDRHEIPVQVLRPGGAGTDAPVVVYYHGGGWTLSNPGNYLALTSWLADELAAVVVAPDYRKAPQHPAPVAAQDAYDVLRWVHDEPDAIGGHGGRVAVAGDSAGGNLSAVVSILARDEGGPTPVGQALIYPATDLTRSHPSSRWRDEAILTGPRMDAFVSHYLSGGVSPRDPVVSPQFAASHRDLPPALVQTAECDPLRDEGDHYADLLRAAGNDVRHTCYVGMPHGFMSFPGVTPVGRQARAELLQSLSAWLEAPATTA
ncbi:alpha/beta hydrolase [Luteipulveratus flavus]|uniref:Alpha/beta hydrolase n=1 Tax=Luteipulveratus flavus TaxID=3031728 RepID=A0ABT6CCF1_9MICO|nr:alpha/beta hydrolase [Luteipulveratus sp. YIM 133296]MDF8266188.1 alpha/beta hydrolase [Luteipulveratus sp. YIM 133296]